MLDFYNSTNKHQAMVFDTENPKKILFKGTSKQCMEYILEKEPSNPVKRDYERNWCQQ